MRYLFVAAFVIVAGCSSTQETALSSPPAQVDAGPVPDGIDPAQTSDDPTYGYTRDNPIVVGGPQGFSGPDSEHLYLRHLRDPWYRPMSFTRRGSMGSGPDGHIIDAYEVTASDGTTYLLYIDMYHEDVHPFSVKAPMGLYFFK